MDRHFQAAAPRENLPVLLALVGIWHAQGCGYCSRAVLPYDQRLARIISELRDRKLDAERPLIESTIRIARSRGIRPFSS